MIINTKWWWKWWWWQDKRWRVRLRLS